MPGVCRSGNHYIADLWLCGRVDDPDTHAGARHDFACIGDGGSRGHAAVYGHGAKHQQYGGDLASERGERGQCHGRDDIEFGSVHRACGSSESGHGGGDGSVAGGPDKVSLGTGDHHADSSGERHDFACIGDGGSRGHAAVYGHRAKHQQYGGDLASERGDRGQCHGRDDIEFGFVHCACGSSESGHSDGDGSVAGGPHKVSLGTGDHHADSSGERHDFACISDGGSRGHAAVYGHRAKHQQYGGDLASERGDRGHRHGGAQIEFGFVHCACGSSESGHSDGDGSVAGGPDKVSLGTGDQHAGSSGERHDFACISDGGSRGHAAVYGHGAKHQQYGGDMASERGERGQCHGRDDIEFGSVHRACGSSESGHGGGDGSVAGGPDKVSLGTGDHHADSSGERHDFACIGDGGSRGHAAVYGHRAKHQQYGGDLASERGDRGQCHGRDDIEFGFVHCACGSSESGHSDGDGSVAGGPDKVSLGTGDHHADSSGERHDFACISDGGSRGHAAVYGHRAKHQQYGGDLASERGERGQCHGRDDIEFGSVHCACGSSESGHGGGNGSVAGGPDKVSLGTGDHHADSSGERHDFACVGDGGSRGHAAVYGHRAKHQQYGGDLASERGDRGQCHGRDDIEFGFVHCACGSSESGHSDGDGSVAGGPDKVSLGTGDQHAGSSGERHDFACISDGGSRGHAAVYGHGAKHQQYGGDMASERGERGQCHGRDDIEFGSVHRACGSSESGHGGGDGSVAGGPDKVSLGTGDHHADSSGERHDFACIGDGGSRGHAAVYGHRAKHQQYGGDLASERGDRGQCHGRDDIEFGFVHCACGSSESGHSDGDGSVAGGPDKVSLGTGDHHADSSGERHDFACISDGGSRGHAAVYGHRAKHQQYGGDLASERGDRGQCHGRDDIEFGSVHRACGSSESGHGGGDGSVAGGPDKVSLGTGDHHAGSSGARHDFACVGDGGSRGHAAVYGHGAKHQQYGGDLASERGERGQCHGRDDIEFGSVHRACGSSESGHGGGDGSVAGGPYKVSLGTGDHHADSSGERHDFACIGDGGSRGHAAVYGHRAKHQQYGGDLASERGDRGQCHGRDDIEFGSVHRACGSSESCHGDGGGCVPRGPDKVRLGTGDHYGGHWHSLL